MDLGAYSKSLKADFIGPEQAISFMGQYRSATLEFGREESRLKQEISEVEREYKKLEYDLKQRQGGAEGKVVVTIMASPPVEVEVKLIYSMLSPTRSILWPHVITKSCFERYVGADIRTGR